MSGRCNYISLFLSRGGGGSSIQRRVKDLKGFFDFENQNASQDMISVELPELPAGAASSVSGEDEVYSAVRSLADVYPMDLDDLRARTLSVNTESLSSIFPIMNLNSYDSMGEPEHAFSGFSEDRLRYKMIRDYTHLWVPQVVRAVVLPGLDTFCRSMMCRRVILLVGRSGRRLCGARVGRCCWARRCMPGIGVTLRWRFIY